MKYLSIKWLRAVLTKVAQQIEAPAGSCFSGPAPE
jgi:hypothetical protein